MAIFNSYVKLPEAKCWMFHIERFERFDFQIFFSFFFFWGRRCWHWQSGSDDHGLVRTCWTRKSPIKDGLNLAESWSPHGASFPRTERLHSWTCRQVACVGRAAIEAQRPAIRRDEEKPQIDPCLFSTIRYYHTQIHTLHYIILHYIILYYITLYYIIITLHTCIHAYMHEYIYIYIYAYIYAYIYIIICIYIYYDVYIYIYIYVYVYVCICIYTYVLYIYYTLR